MERTDYNELRRRRRKAGAEWPELQQCFVLPRRLFFRGLDFESGAHLYHWRSFVPGVSRAVFSPAETSAPRAVDCARSRLASSTSSTRRSTPKRAATTFMRRSVASSAYRIWLDDALGDRCSGRRAQSRESSTRSSSRTRSGNRRPTFRGRRRDDDDDDAERELFRRELVALRARLEPSRCAPPLLVGTKRKTLDRTMRLDAPDLRRLDALRGRPNYFFVECRRPATRRSRSSRSRFSR